MKSRRVNIDKGVMGIFYYYVLIIYTIKNNQNT